MSQAKIIQPAESAKKLYDPGDIYKDSGGVEGKRANFQEALKALIEQFRKHVRNCTEPPHLLAVAARHEKGQAVHLIHSELDLIQQEELLRELNNRIYKMRVDSMPAQIDGTKAIVPKDIIDHKAVKGH